ncbi:hypothetical protein RKD44_001855 [Streptomyces collinus]
MTASCVPVVVWGAAAGHRHHALLPAERTLTTSWCQIVVCLEMALRGSLKEAEMTGVLLRTGDGDHVEDVGGDRALHEFVQLRVEIVQKHAEEEDVCLRRQLG